MCQLGRAFLGSRLFEAPAHSPIHEVFDVDPQAILLTPGGRRFSASAPFNTIAGITEDVPPFLRIGVANPLCGGMDTNIMNGQQPLGAGDVKQHENRNGPNWVRHENPQPQNPNQLQDRPDPIQQNMQNGEPPRQNIQNMPHPQVDDFRRWKFSRKRFETKSLAKADDAAIIDFYENIRSLEKHISWYLCSDLVNAWYKDERMKAKHRKLLAVYGEPRNFGDYLQAFPACFLQLDDTLVETFRERLCKPEVKSSVKTLEDAEAAFYTAKARFEVLTSMVSAHQQWRRENKISIDVSRGDVGGLPKGTLLLAALRHVPEFLRTKLNAALLYSNERHRDNASAETFFERLRVQLSETTVGEANLTSIARVGLEQKTEDSRREPRHCSNVPMDLTRVQEMVDESARSTRREIQEGLDELRQGESRLLNEIRQIRHLSDDRNSGTPTNRRSGNRGPRNKRYNNRTNGTVCYKWRDNGFCPRGEHCRYKEGHKDQPNNDRPYHPTDVRYDHRNDGPRQDSYRDRSPVRSPAENGRERERINPADGGPSANNQPTENQIRDEKDAPLDRKICEWCGFRESVRHESSCRQKGNWCTTCGLTTHLAAGCFKTKPTPHKEAQIWCYICGTDTHTIKRCFRRKTLNN